MSVIAKWCSIEPLLHISNINVHLYIFIYQIFYGSSTSGFNDDILIGWIFVSALLAWCWKYTFVYLPSVWILLLNLDHKFQFHTIKLKFRRML